MDKYPPAVKMGGMRYDLVTETETAPHDSSIHQQRTQIRRGPYTESTSGTLTKVPCGGLLILASVFPIINSNRRI
jgi:hypothetical protein